MAIEILLNHPRILHQTADDDMDVPELPIAICNDAAPVIVISQEGREITINLNSVRELCDALKELHKELIQAGE